MNKFLWSLSLAVALTACESAEQRLARFQQAVTQGDIASVQKILKSDPSLAKQPVFDFRQTALHQAPNEQVAQLLIDAGADVNATDDRMETPLHTSTDPGVSKRLLAQGANLNAQNSMSCSPIFTARNASVLDPLVNAGLSIHMPKNPAWPYETPLYWAVQDGRTDTAQGLIERGADISIKARENMSLLHIAARSGRTEVAQLLIDKGLWVDDADKYKATPLHHAVLNNQTAMVKLLLDNRADPNAQLSKYAATVDYKEAAARVGPRADGRMWGEKEAGGATPLKIATSDEVRDLLKAAGAAE